MNFLQLQNAKREGGSNKQERHYLDFIISGQTLRKILGINTYDLISPFGWGNDKEYERELLHMLTLNKKIKLKNRTYNVIYMP